MGLELLEGITHIPSALHLFPTQMLCLYLWPSQETPMPQFTLVLSTPQL